LHTILFKIVCKDIINLLIYIKNYIIFVALNKTIPTKNNYYEKEKEHPQNSNYLLIFK